MLFSFPRWVRRTFRPSPVRPIVNQKTKERIRQLEVRGLQAMRAILKMHFPEDEEREEPPNLPATTGGGLPLELALVAEGDTSDFLDDELADGSTWVERNAARAEIDEFERAGSGEAGMDGWCGEMHEQATAGIDRVSSCAADRPSTSRFMNSIRTT